MLLLHTLKMVAIIPQRKMNNNLRWIPFHLTSEHAIRVFNKFHAPVLNDIEIEKCSKVLLPFFSVSAKVNSFVMAHLRYPASDVRHHIVHNWDGFRTPGLQIFASNSYNRYLINNIKSDDLFLGMNPIGSSDRLDVGEALSFSLDPSAALIRYADPFIGRKEHERVQSFLRAKYGHRVQSFNSFMSWDSCDIAPCYLPCFIVDFVRKKDGEKFTTYVDGVFGKVSGPSLVNTDKIAARIAAISALLTSSVHIPDLTLKSIASWLTLFVFVPYASSKFVAENIPWINQSFTEHKQNFVHGWDSSEIAAYDPDIDPIWWDWKKVGDRFSEWHERLAVEQETKDWHEYHEYMNRYGHLYRGSASSKHHVPRHHDMLGYYETLGLKGKEAETTVDEIQKAFRLLASRYHPDRFSGDPEKQRESAAIFQRISLAYSVLRDGDKRKLYDTGNLRA